MVKNLTDKQVEEIYLSFLESEPDSSLGSFLGELWSEEDFTREDVISKEEYKQTIERHKQLRKQQVNKILEKYNGS